MQSKWLEWGDEKGKRGMNGNTLFKWGKHAVIGMLCIAGLAWAQPIDPWLADGLNRQIQQNRNNAQGASRGPSAAEVRAWHERERKIQAEIAKHKATPYYYAIAYDFSNNNILGGEGITPKKELLSKH